MRRREFLHYGDGAGGGAGTQTQDGQIDQTPKTQDASQNGKPTENAEDVYKRMSAAEKAEQRRAKIESEAAYYKRNPEELKILREHIGSDSNPETDSLKRELEMLKLDNARQRAMAKFGLTDEDAEFIVGDTPEKIAQSAEKLAARLNVKNGVKKTDADDDGEGEPEPEPASRGGKVADLPEPPSRRYKTPLEKAEADFEKFEHDRLKKTG